MTSSDGSPTNSGGGFLVVMLEDALAENGIEAAPVEGFPGVLTGTVAGSFGQWNFFAQADEPSLGVVVYSVFPGNVPEQRRIAIAELCTRANYVLRYGNLEMDFADGEARARTSARGGAESLDFNVMTQLIKTNLEIAEIFFPAVQDVSMNGASAVTALERLLKQVRRG